MSFCCLAIGSHINKALFGTNNGTIVLYDTFSRKFKVKKLSVKSIVHVVIYENSGYVLTSDQKVHVINMNLNRLEEINTFSTVNENKLHEKVTNFELVDSDVWTFGSELKLYDQEVDESQQHNKRQMEKTYSWRLVSLKNQSGNKQLEQRIC
jgi:phenylpropionate dioxygenase-like ring-hydroxylating dioxygenase large terminal subunit